MDNYKNKLYMVRLDATLNSKDELTVLVRAENQHAACMDAVAALTHSGYSNVTTRGCIEVLSNEVC